MRLLPKAWNLSDDEYVERQRRTLRFVDRFRCWLVAIGLVLLAGLLWMAQQMHQALLGLAAPPNNPNDVDFARAGFFLGAALGFFLGWSMVTSLHGWFHALTGFRSERLLIAHYKQKNPIPAAGDDLLDDADH